MNFAQKLGIALNEMFVAQQVKDPGALKFFLNASADAEANGEAGVFVRVRPLLDGKFAKLVERHSADEVRHAALFTARLEELGGTIEPVPENLRIVDRLGKAAGNVFDKEEITTYEAAKAYLLLYAIERRAIERFALMESALRMHPGIAGTIAGIAADERRHLLYCVAVSRALLPDDAEWTKLRDEMVALEEVEFTAYSKEFQWHLLDRVFTTMPWWQRTLWKMARNFADLLGQKQSVLPVGGAEELPSGRPAIAAALAA